MIDSVSQTPLVLLRRIPFWAKTAPDATAWLEPIEASRSLLPVSWAAFANLVRIQSLWFKQQNMLQQMPLTIHLPNGLDWLVSVFAIQTIGAIDVPLDCRLSLEQAMALAKSIGSQALITSEGSNLVLIGLNDASPVPKQIPKPKFSNTVGLPLHALDQWDDELQTLSPSSTSTLLFTSGTTGEPKAVSLSHKNLSSNASGKWLAVPQLMEDRRLSVLSFAHAYARTSDIGTWLIAGSELCAVNTVDELLEWAPIVQPTLINTVPYVIQRAAQTVGDQPIKPVFGGRLRWLGCGGAPLSAGLFQRLSAEGITVIQGYGLTETSPVISSASPQSAYPGCVGEPIPGVQVRIDDNGELWCRGPNIMQGYWRDETATHARIQDGWLYTGDQAAWSAEGQLKILGRTDDTITLATGHKVAPSAIERELLLHPKIKQCLVVGDDQGQLCVLYWSEDKSVTEAQLKSECDDLLKSFYWYEHPKRFIPLPRMLTHAAGELTLKGTPRRKRIEKGSGLLNRDAIDH